LTSLVGTWRRLGKAKSVADAVLLDEVTMTVQLADEGVQLDLGGIGKVMHWRGLHKF